MTTSQAPVIDWPQPFSPEEYELRRRTVARKLRSAGLDAILVTKPADIYYLTGYDMIWFYLEFLTSCVLLADTSEIIFFDYPGHETIVHTTPEIQNVVWMTREEPLADSQVIASSLLKAGLTGAKVAVQKRWGYVPHADVTATLASVLTESGMFVEDGSLIIEEIRLHKTPAEIECLRNSAAMADDAMIAARDTIAPGVMETEIQAAILQSLMKSGGGDPAIRCMVGSGPRSGTHHSPAQHRKIQENELVFIDFCSSLHRYHVNLNRTFATGSVDERWFEFMDRAAQTIDHVVAEVKPGDNWSVVQTFADQITDRNNLRDKVWFVGGYALGIAMPPDWVGEFWVEPRGSIPDRKLEPGMIFNFEGQFDIRDGWVGGNGCAYIETLLMTETGLKVLSKLPRTLVSV